MKHRLAIECEPWAINEVDFMALASGDISEFELSDELLKFDVTRRIEKLDIDESSGIAILNVTGPLMSSPNAFARLFLGAVDSVRLENRVRVAASDPGIKALFVNLDSPGGTYTGTPELADAIAACAGKKLVTVFSNGTVTSAAYWVAASATELVGTSSSQWGSIGVFRPHVDLSKARENSGISIELFRSGENKAAGAFQTSLSDSQTLAIQNDVDELGRKFRSHVTAFRPRASIRSMEGQSFYADEAEKAGLIDRVVSNFDEAFQGTATRVDSGNFGESVRQSFASLNESEMWERYGEIWDIDGQSAARALHADWLKARSSI